MTTTATPTEVSAERPGAAHATESLVQMALAAGRGDAFAVTELVTRTSTTVWRVCAALVDRASADDLTQDTYLRAIRSLATYRGESEPLPWLLTIARRVCAEEIARRQRDRHTASRLAGERAAPPSDVAGRVVLLDALARLPQHRRAALVLTGVVGLSYAEAAAVCGCPVGTIRSRVARARADLTRALIPGPITDAALHDPARSPVAAARSRRVPVTARPLNPGRWAPAAVGSATSGTNPTQSPTCVA